MKQSFLFPLFALVLVPVTADCAYAQKITTFDVPGAVYTQPVAISSAGDVIGSYGVPNTQIVRGFVRDRNNRFTTFDVGGMYTVPTAINSAGQITGIYEQYPPLPQAPILASFLREPTGEIVTFVVPGVTFMYATVIDSTGEIAGLMRNTSGLGYVVFLRSPAGDITTFEIPGASFLWPMAVNARGQMVGYGPIPDQGGGFLREPDGTIVNLEVPGVFPTNSQALAINSKGQIAGSYEFICPDPQVEGEDCTTDYHGFLRELDGSYKTFDFPNALATYPVGIDSRGEIVGSYLGTDRHLHGFLRRKDGSFVSFDTDAPNATDTYVKAVSPSGEITGEYVEPVASHGFLVVLHRDVYDSESTIESGLPPTS